MLREWLEDLKFFFTSLLFVERVPSEAKGASGFGAVRFPTARCLEQIGLTDASSAEALLNLGKAQLPQVVVNDEKENESSSRNTLLLEIKLSGIWSATKTTEETLVARVEIPEEIWRRVLKSRNSFDPTLEDLVSPGSFGVELVADLLSRVLHPNFLQVFARAHLALQRSREHDLNLKGRSLDQRVS